MALPILSKRAEFLAAREEPSRHRTGGFVRLLGTHHLPPQFSSCMPKDPGRIPRQQCRTQAFRTLGMPVDATQTTQGQSVSTSTHGEAAFAVQTATQRSCGHPGMGSTGGSCSIGYGTTTQQQHLEWGPSLGCTVEGPLQTSAPIEGGPPERLRSSPSEVFRRLPSGFQAGDPSVMGLPVDPPAVATPNFAAKGVLPSLPPLPLLPQPPLASGALAGDWLAQRLQQQPRQQLSPLPTTRRISYRS